MPCALDDEQRAVAQCENFADTVAAAVQTSGACDQNIADGIGILAQHAPASGHARKANRSAVRTVGDRSVLVQRCLHRHPKAPAVGGERQALQTEVVASTQFQRPVDRQIARQCPFAEQMAVRIGTPHPWIQAESTIALAGPDQFSVERIDAQRLGIRNIAALRRVGIEAAVRLKERHDTAHRHARGAGAVQRKGGRIKTSRREFRLVVAEQIPSAGDRIDIHPRNAAEMLKNATVGAGDRRRTQPGERFDAVGPDLVEPEISRAGRSAARDLGDD